ncbi:hypothetical protein [uncultured Shimia sp.]|uniref:hypothetical protein n=1 Tax=uncultured Shimia sp. TaxID=573152 RepID=UPI0026303A8B|nr:hypothetical protein [uncultured Shimia sp.]
MRLFREEEFRPAAAPRHARLFELIRQDNLTPIETQEFLARPATLAAQDRFRELAENSLRRVSP